METKNKQRIIGGIVLLAVLAIFLPLLFHNSRPSTQLKISGDIPKAPNTPDIQLQLPLNNSNNDNQTGSTVSEGQFSNSESVKAAVQQTPAVTRKILNTAPLPARLVLTPNTIVEKQVKNKSVRKIRAAKISARHLRKHHPIVLEKRVASPASLSTALSVPTAWVIQVASFSDQQNADRLTKQLRAKGLDVYTRKSGGSHTEVTRVYVGPEIDLNKAKKIQQKLQQKFKLNGVLKKYTL